MTFAQVFVLKTSINLLWVFIILAVLMNFPNGNFDVWDVEVYLNITDQTGAEAP